MFTRESRAERLARLKREVLEAERVAAEAKEEESLRLRLAKARAASKASSGGDDLLGDLGSLFDGVGDAFGFGKGKKGGGKKR